MENSVNERVKMLRTSQDLSQSEFAGMVGTSLMTISRMENGITPVTKKQINRIVEVFGVDLNWLVNGVGELSVNMRPNEKYENPWKDALVSQLKDENSFLKEQIGMMREMIQIIKPQANFLNGIDVAGLFVDRNPINTVSAYS